MTRDSLKSRWRPTPANLIAASLIVLGLALMSISWWFLILVGLGTFGPGILREIGWLRDKDEFQWRAAYRAGYHAFLVAGVIAVLLVAYIRSGERHLKDPEELATLFLIILFTWFLSSMLSFVGAQKAAIRILIGYGTFWLLFIIASHFDNPASLFMEAPIVIGPFFLLAFLASRWPRLSGLLLLAAAAFFLYRFHWYAIGPMGLINQTVTMILFLGPLLASGIALLNVRRARERGVEE